MTPTQDDASERRPAVPWRAIAAITVLGAVVRLIPVLSADFPLNDGGLFAEMILAIRANGFALPAAAHYNAMDLPFAYPPLGLYVAALLSESPSSALTTLRFLPAAVSIAAIPLAYAVFRPLLSTEATALLATAAFAVMPRSYNWAIAGGGVTRSIGLLLALVAVAGAIRMYRGRALRWPIIAGVALGLTGLSHPQAAVFAGASVCLLVVFAGTSAGGGPSSTSGSRGLSPF